MEGWIGKIIFLKTQEDRVYQGKVIDETKTTLTLIDKYNCKVEISKIDIKLCQEERPNGHQH